MSSFMATLGGAWRSWMALFGNDPTMAAAAALSVFLFAAAMVKLLSTKDQ